MTEPLVSVCIITYNSSKYIYEALESVKNQTYQNIELIISDDCSTDDTVEICRLWLSENSSRFFESQLITSSINTGISANCNRAILKAQAEWVKLFAGDDRLLPICIEANVDYYKKHPEATFIVSEMETFNEKSHVNTFGHKCRKICLLNSIEQYAYFRKHGLFTYTPACMYKKAMLEDVGYMDERIPMFEDMPLLHNILKKGYKVDCLPIPTVEYRLSDSITRPKDHHISLAFHNSLKTYHKLYKKDFYTTWKDVFGIYYTLKISVCRDDLIIRYLGNNKERLATRFICFLFSILMPGWWVFLFKNRLCKKGFK